MNLRSTDKKERLIGFVDVVEMEGLGRRKSKNTSPKMIGYIFICTERPNLNRAVAQLRVVRICRILRRVEDGGWRMGIEDGGLKVVFQDINDSFALTRWKQE